MLYLFLGSNPMQQSSVIVIEDLTEPHTSMHDELHPSIIVEPSFLHQEEVQELPEVTHLIIFHFKLKDLRSFCHIFIT